MSISSLSLDSYPSSIGFQIRIDPERNALQEKTGQLWECIGRKLGPSGIGFLYQFTLKPEYQFILAFDAKQIEIFPSLEMSPENVLLLFNKDRIQDLVRCKEKVLSDLKDQAIQTILNLTIPQFYTGLQFEVTLTRLENEIKFIESALKTLNYALEAAPFLNQLGYKSEQLLGTLELTLPDQEALMFCYDRIRESEPALDLPMLSIATSKGRASDIAYIQALINDDGLLSTGNEFVHDQLQHIHQLMTKAYLGASRYHIMRKRDQTIAQSNLNKILRTKAELQKKESAVFNTIEKQKLKDNIEFIVTLLGAVVDTLSNSEPDEEGINTAAITYEYVLTSMEWQIYFFNLYGNRFNPSVLKELLPLLDKV